MALYLLQPGIQPLGQFDLLDTDLGSILGGEIGVFDEASRVITATEKAAQDVLDGYVADLIDAGTPTASRPVVRIADGYSTVFTDPDKSNTRIEPRKAFYLMDEGTANYGTNFGGLIGNPLGLNMVAASQLGPHTAQGSGKVTLYGMAGKYAVSADAVATDLSPTAGNLNDTPLPGSLLYREHNTGLMTVNSVSLDRVAMFVEISGNRSLVTTPGHLVGSAEAFNRVTVHYFGPGKTNN